MVWIPGGEFSMGAADPPEMDDVGMKATTDSRPIHRGDDLRLVSVNLRPARRGQYQNRQSSSDEVLLAAQLLVGCDEGIEGRFRRCEEGAVIEPGPAHLISRGDSVTDQRLTQRCGSTLVKENSHARLAVGAARLRRRQTLLRVPQHKLHLFARHAGEPLQEIIHPPAVFEVLEQCLDRHACAFEQPRAADFSRHAFHHRTLTPIKHDVILRDAPRACKREFTNRNSRRGPGQNADGSFLCTDQYCSRYMVGTRGKGEISTGTNHLGFRCVKSAMQRVQTSAGDIKH